MVSNLFKKKCIGKLLKMMLGSWSGMLSVMHGFSNECKVKTFIVLIPKIDNTQKSMILGTLAFAIWSIKLFSRFCFIGFTLFEEYYHSSSR